MRFLIGNWKMQCTQTAALQLAQDLSFNANKLNKNTIKVVVCPSFVHLDSVKTKLSSDIHLGAQDCHTAEKGAFTGSVSALMLKEIGATFVIVGHSERRQGLAESSQLVAEKALAASSQGLCPIVCVGELLAARDANQAEAVVQEQLRALPSGLSHFMVAYEPVWAIGTGQVATAEIVAKMHQVIFEQLVAQYGQQQAETTPILYGGSVKADNASGFVSLPHVDGFLVGGASLDAEAFILIAQAMV